MPTCPQCGNKLVPIVHGYAPHRTKEDMEKSINYGCIEGPFDPKYGCRNCGYICFHKNIILNLIYKIGFRIDRII